VDESWTRPWNWPDPPQPAWQLEELFCDWLAYWFVAAVFDAEESAELVKL
jgi:hypothetical protein